MFFYGNRQKIDDDETGKMFSRNQSICATGCAPRPKTFFKLLLLSVQLYANNKVLCYLTVFVTGIDSFEKLLLKGGGSLLVWYYNYRGLGTYDEEYYGLGEG